MFSRSALYIGLPFLILVKMENITSKIGTPNAIAETIIITLVEVLSPPNIAIIEII